MLPSAEPSELEDSAATIEPFRYLRHIEIIYTKLQSSGKMKTTECHIFSISTYDIKHLSYLIFFYGQDYSELFVF